MNGCENKEEGIESRNNLEVESKTFNRLDLDSIKGRGLKCQRHLIQGNEKMLMPRTKPGNTGGPDLGKR